MRNVKVQVKGGKMVLTIDLTEEGIPSKSGKSVVIGSTYGNQTVLTADGQVTVGLNVYRPA